MLVLETTLRDFPTGARLARALRAEILADRVGSNTSHCKTDTLRRDAVLPWIA